MPSEGSFTNHHSPVKVPQKNLNSGMGKAAEPGPYFKDVRILF